MIEKSRNGSSRVLVGCLLCVSQVGSEWRVEDVGGLGNVFFFFVNDINDQCAKGGMQVL